MPSRAYNVVLQEMLVDAYEQIDMHQEAVRSRSYTLARLMSCNRAAVGAAISAWEGYIEALAREAVEALRPPVGVPPMAWPALSAFAAGQVNLLHTPSTANADRLFRDCFGIPSVSTLWTWRGVTSAQAQQMLADALRARQDAGHGLHPRPTILHPDAARLPRFLERLARATDDAVRTHLVGLGVAEPWPA